MSTISEISEFLQKGRAKNVKQLVTQAIEEGEDPKVILNDGLLNGMMSIGERFKKNEVFVPEVLVAARALNAGLTILEPKLIEVGNEPVGKAIIGTVKGDLHDIGKNLVSLMLENYGFEVHDLGKDVKCSDIIAAAKEFDADIIGLSALMTTTMQKMKDVVKARNDEKLKAKIMIGGAVITQNYCDEIGADGYSKDAQAAVTVAEELIKK